MSGAPCALVLGGTSGLLGQALMAVVREQGWQAVSLSRAEVDVAASDAAERLESLVDAHAPRCLFNAVGYTRVDDAEDDLEGATLLNRTLPAMLGRIMRSRPECALVHYSTDFVFNGRKDGPYTTEDAPDPLNVYGATKLAGEEALLSMGLPNCLVLRTAWLFGPHKGNFVRTILDACAARHEISVVHDQFGSPTYTPDLARYSLELVRAGASGLFHVVNSGEASWCELASEAVRLAQVRCSVSAVASSAFPRRATRPAWSVLDTGALTRATGIAPRPWMQALREYIFASCAPR